MASQGKVQDRRVQLRREEPGAAALSDEHRVVADLPRVIDKNCTGSGFDFVSILDYTGLTKVIVAFATFSWNLKAIFAESRVLTDPFDQRILSEKLLPYIRKIYDLDDRENEVYLSDVRFDLRGHPRTTSNCSRDLAQTPQTVQRQSWKLFLDGP